MSHPVSDAPGSEMMVCVGSSMHPTLKVLDVLYYQPYGDQRIRPGDVIVFASPGKKRTTHRVVSVGPHGVQTRGDNNLLIDDWALRQDDVIGQIVSVRRRNRVRPVRGGVAGQLTGLKCHTVCYVKNSVLRLLQPAYDLACRSGVFRIWIPAGLQPRVVRFQKPGVMEMNLFMGNKCIGYYSHVTNRWIIRPPFRLFVDEPSMFSTGISGSSGVP